MQVIEAQCASILEPHDHLHISQSACLQRFQRRSQRANLPVCMSLAGPTGKGMGRAGRCCRLPGQLRQAQRTAWPARSQARARPLGGVVPAGRRARRPASWPARPASGSWSRPPGCTPLPGPGQLRRRCRPLAVTPAGCQDCPNPASPASAADASDVFPGMPATGSEVEYDIAPGRSSSTGRPDARALAANGCRLPDQPGPATPGHQDLAAVLAGPSPALPPRWRTRAIIGALLPEIDREHLGGSPSRLRRPHSAGTRLPSPARACPAPCSPGL
jgi:hypothetical protein